ncbi:hypothetical protein [Streptomyces sp. NPDC127100]|uniref:hypothetical protein n=1 Tax=Streptomyces sp. NPDC127100 TaxID=3347138 RepID=UPI00365BCF48
MAPSEVNAERVSRADGCLVQNTFGEGVLDFEVTAGARSGALCLFQYKTGASQAVPVRRTPP